MNYTLADWSYSFCDNIEVIYCSFHMSDKEKIAQKAVGVIKWYRVLIWSGDNTAHHIRYVESLTDKEAERIAKLSIHDYYKNKNLAHTAAPLITTITIVKEPGSRHNPESRFR